MLMCWCISIAPYQFPLRTTCVIQQTIETTSHRLQWNHQLYKTSENYAAYPSIECEIFVIFISVCCMGSVYIWTFSYAMNYWYKFFFVSFDGFFENRGMSYLFIVHVYSPEWECTESLSIEARDVFLFHTLTDWLTDWVSFVMRK